ncbi:MAG: hypothetical protein HYZ00_00835, partial [Candidatus Hydrogenedentes bacterium]|nr:hypothetical protein [Candidatus Hydrogenedentota bacterium]
MTAKHSHPRRSNTGLIFAGITAVAFLGVAALCLLAQVQRNTAVAKLRSAPGFVRVTEAVAQPKRPAQPPDSAPASVTPLPD